MKIAILTLPLHTNYGGILQAYALQTVLQKMGHNVVILDKVLYSKELPLYKKYFVYFKRLIKKYIFKSISTIYIEEHFNDIKRTIRQNTQKFIDVNVNRYEINNLYNLKQGKYDTIIVGSDQIWRPEYYKPIENAFLDFANKWSIKRIAYAPSFGTNEWEYTEEQTIKCKKLLSKFNSVSVRELSGVTLCKEKFNINAELVLDPTLLLDKKDYIRLFESKGVEKSDGDLMVYILDNSDFATDLVREISKKRGLKPFKTNCDKTDSWDVPLLERIQPPLENWLRGFYDAKLVVTDSFHACVFSIIFNKPFIVINNNKRGNARIDSLLKVFNQEYRLIHDVIDINNNEKIYTSPNVEDLLSKKKQDSLSFLVNSLDN